MKFDLAAFDAAPLENDPYPHVIVPGFLPAEALAHVNRDFPKLDMLGSFPPDALRYGPGFAALLEGMEGDAVRDAVGRKFGIDLAGRPTLCTVRGQVGARDGQIHRDSDFKIVTLLLYLNEGWHTDGGRLRLLRAQNDLENYVTEIPPVGGTLLAFRCTPNAWHGHKPFYGQRRTLQLNYVSDARMMRRELARHRFAARVKSVKRLMRLVPKSADL
jgi:hypothetical protein